MKISFITTLLLIAIATSAQEFNAETYTPPYTLATPEKWGIELFAIATEFAPTIA